MIRNKYVDNYIKQWRDGNIIFNQERIDLVNYLENEVLIKDNIHFDNEKIDKCIKFINKWYFPVQDYQKFIIAFVFLMDDEIDTPYFTEFALFMGRGAGKNGFISAISDFMTTPIHGIKKYDISIVANSEDQAKTSFNEIYDVLLENKRNKTGERPKAPYEVSKTEIKNRSTNSIIKYNTSNTKTKDGGREGCVIFDEIAIYESADMVNVKRGGLGKVPHDRTFYISTDGFVREGFMDSMKDRVLEVLAGKNTEDRIFPFYCKLDNPNEIDNENMWEKANPMLHPPLTGYASNLKRKIKEEYNVLHINRSNKPEFVTKRMNLPEQDPESVVAPWEEIKATNKPFPELENKACIGGLDYALVRDFASVGLLFRENDQYYWKTHSFIRREFLETTHLEPPIEQWADDGLLTIVDDDVIDISYIVNWFIQQQEKYNLTKVISDNFRTDIVRRPFEDADIPLEVIKNPTAIHGLLAPRIDTMFAKKQITFGDNPLMRWFTNNVAVKMQPDGSKKYIKKDEVRRKTDGFHAMLHALYRADEILEYDQPFIMADINF
ncbi:terminase TerL endonuclease subunit [Staphylococcus saprophyticus]|uniref:terminase TerL endonuclease subunit n=1 Tax=Staphylococcus saprophyticus TaxID=29385 RepID=UPI000E039EAC|nr:terminase TerL endonuclease subunit [Staphylococcus saprophyticus]MDW4153342.1 terminase large subunit [Staphylococcus saprophyticus]MDW4184291.1 terminase large subunit [Staphylococcus saprophyticus]MDW4352521.1 terminase large subunit [Staphylococcus saprophyticus]MDW4460806.1 terminase large subunit [Staphylococcus saprophyticus]MDW4468290.1 terminase large subunit [Staphylococcus saprophyticus]